MEKLIKVKEARILVSNSDERKEFLIKKLNDEIKSQSRKGLTWAHLPSEANTEEREWLKNELTINEFEVQEGNPAVQW